MPMSIQTSSSTIDAKRYLAWVGAVLEAASETSLSTAVSLLSEAGAPPADAEAIVAGISAFKDKRWRQSSSPVARPGLNAYSGWHNGRVGERPPPFSSARRPIVAALATLCAVGLCVVGYFLYHARVPVSATGPKQPHTAASGGRISNPGQLSSSTRHSPNRHRERESAKPEHTKPRHQSISRTESSPMAPGSSPEPVATFPVAQQPPTRRGDCPPGVDRIGCTVSATDSTFPSKATIPVNAHYEPNGYGWQCNSGYVERGGACSKLIVPPHAHLDISGHGWFCDPGFVPKEDTCQSY